MVHRNLREPRNQAHSSRPANKPLNFVAMRILHATNELPTKLIQIEQMQEEIMLDSGGTRMELHKIIVVERDRAFELCRRSPSWRFAHSMIRCWLPRVSRAPLPRTASPKPRRCRGTPSHSGARGTSRWSSRRRHEDARCLVYR